MKITWLAVILFAAAAYWVPSFAQDIDGAGKNSQSPKKTISNEIKELLNEGDNLSRQVAKEKWDREEQERSIRENQFQSLAAILSGRLRWLGFSRKENASAYTFSHKTSIGVTYTLSIEPDAFFGPDRNKISVQIILDLPGDYQRPLTVVSAAFNAKGNLTAPAQSIVEGNAHAQKSMSIFLAEERRRNFTLSKLNALLDRFSSGNRFNLTELIDELSVLDARVASFLIDTRLDAADYPRITHRLQEIGLTDHKPGTDVKYEVFSKTFAPFAVEVFINSPGFRSVFGRVINYSTCDSAPLPDYDTSTQFLEKGGVQYI